MKRLHNMVFPLKKLSGTIKCNFLLVCPTDIVLETYSLLVERLNQLPISKLDWASTSQKGLSNFDWCQHARNLNASIYVLPQKHLTKFYLTIKMTGHIICVWLNRSKKNSIEKTC